MAAMLAAAGVGLMIALIAAGAWRSGGAHEDRAGLLVLGVVAIPALAALAVAGAGSGTTPVVIALAAAAGLAAGLMRPALARRRRPARVALPAAEPAEPAEALRRAA